MWHRTFAGLLSGLVFFLFIPTALSLFFPKLTALMIMLTVLLFIPLWAGVMTYCYAAKSAKDTWLRALKFAVPSTLLYLTAYLTMGLAQ